MPNIDDPLSAANNVGKSTYQFADIQKIFKVGYTSAFMGCFCDCHFDRGVYTDPHKTTNKIVQISSLHPVFQVEGGEPAVIQFLDENNEQQTAPISSLYFHEKVVPSEMCDSILAKIIYSQAQFKAAEDNAQQMQP